MSAAVCRAATRPDGAAGPGAGGAGGGARRGPALRHVCSRLQGGNQARRAGAPGAGDVERRAVVGRGPDPRQSQGNIDPALDIEGLERDQALVVVHADGGIVGRPRRLVEQGIGRVRAGGVDAGLPQRGDRGCDNRILLAAQCTGLAGMGVEAGKGEPRCGDPEIPAQRLGRDPPGGLDISDGKTGRDLRQRNMHGHQTDPEPGTREHHRDRCASGAMLQIFGMARKPEPGRHQGRFLNRVGHHRPGKTPAHQIDRRIDAFDHGCGGFRIGAPGLGADGGPERQDRQAIAESRTGLVGAGDRDHRRVATGQVCERAQAVRRIDGEKGRRRRTASRGPAGPPGFQGDLAADAGRFAHGQRQHPAGFARVLSVTVGSGDCGSRRRRHGRGQIRISIMAARRRSRRYCRARTPTFRSKRLSRTSLRVGGLPAP